MCEGGRGAASMDRTASVSRRRRRRPEAGSLVEEEAGGCGGPEATRKARGWRAVAFMIGFFAAASMASISFSLPLANYLIKRYNMKQNTATNVTNIFNGFLSFSPAVGAFIADAFWGRFRTLMFGIVFGIIAMVVITLSATIRQLKPPPCSDLARQAGTCASPSGLHRAVLYIGMGLLVMAAAGTNPTGLPFGADQFDQSNERHKEGIKRFYSWYYATMMMATFLTLTFIVYIEDKVSWGLGFAIPTGLMLVTFVVFLVGTPFYVYVPPEGSIFSSVARVIVASCRKCRLRLPHSDNARQQEAVLYSPPDSGNGRVFKLPLTLNLSSLNKAAIVTDADEIRPDGSASRPWNLCSVQQVEEVKCLVKVIPIWISGVVWFILVTEITNYTFLQALTMDLHMGKSFTIPAFSIIAIFYLSVALFVPVYDLLIARVAKRLTKAEGGLTLLQRQGVGIVVGVLAFVVAAVVERRRRDSALDHGGKSPISVFLLAPQLAVMGVSGSFSMVGQMEFYNTQFPEQMRTLGNAAFYCAQGASNYLATLVVNIVNARTRRHAKSGWVSDDINAGRLDNFYYTMAVFGAVNFGYFLVCSYFFRYKGQQADSSQGPAGDSTSTNNSETMLVK